MVQNRPLGKIPGFRSWRIGAPGPGSNTSTQMKAKAPWCIRPSVPLKNTLHEAHVRVHERERPDLLRHRVGARDLTIEVCEANETVKVGDGRGFGIWWIEIGKPGPEHMKVATQDRRTPRDGDGLVRLVRVDSPGLHTPAPRAAPTPAAPAAVRMN